MKNNQPYNSLREFYPYYLQQHTNATCRFFHFIGTLGFILLFTSSIIFKSWWLLLIAPMFGYGFAWIGHFLFEKNKPAALSNPIYSLISDFIMFYHTITFQIDKKTERVNQDSE
jgi:hypothetical protein